MTASGTPAARGGGAVVALLFLLAALPILLVRYPPVMDMPNHLARIWLLAGGLEDPALGAMYRADWSQAATNVGVDAVSVLLARVLPLPVVATLLLLLAVLGPALAGAALHRRVFGHWSPWVAIFLVTAWSTTAVAGFVSFQISLAAGLLAAALFSDRLTRPWGASMFLIHLLLAALLLVIHVFGLLIYVAAVAGLALGPGFPLAGGVGKFAAKVGRIVLLGIVAAMPVAVLFLFAPHPPGGETGVLWPDLPYMLNPGRIAKTLASPFITYDYRADGLFLLVAALAVVAALAAPGRRVHGGLALAAAAVGSGAVWMPLAIGDASWLQQRFAVMAALLFFAAVAPGLGKPAWRRIVFGLVVLAALGRIGWIGAVWRERERDAEDVFAVARALPRGAALLVVAQETPEAEQRSVGRYLQGGVWDPELAYRHLPALLVAERRVFLPTL